MNPIASDSDNEKRIYKAEARASRKSRVDRGGRRGRWRGRPYRRTYRRAIESSQSDTNQTQTQQTKRLGLCFSCSMPGHWKFECSSLKATNYSNNKISSVSALSACKESNKSPDIISKINHNIGESKSSSCEDLIETDEKCLSPAGR